MSFFLAKGQPFFSSSATFCFFICIYSFSENEDDIDFIQYGEPPIRHTYPYASPYAPIDRNMTLPLKQKHVSMPRVDSPEEEYSLRKYLGGSIGLISLITENLLSHPFVVLRRQCQVHHNSTKYKRT